jgi:hypothetical protein
MREAVRPVLLTAGVRWLTLVGPSSIAFKVLRAGWSNEGWSGDVAFLRAAWDRATRAHRILECGSGLSTLVLSIAGRRTGTEIWSLEHVEEWQSTINRALSRYALRGRVLYTPLTSYGEFDWYALPPGLPARFDLVVCDGPPEHTRGGRYGLVPACRDRLRGATILLDDADRAGEQRAMDAWVRESGARCHLVSAEGGTYAVLELPDA